MEERRIKVGSETYLISSDDQYIKKIGEVFEPKTTKLISALSNDENNTTALDIGANIGLTALLISQFYRKVIAFEASPSTFSLLSNNMVQNNVRNVECINVAAAEENGVGSITVASWDRPGESISEINLSDPGYRQEPIIKRTLDGLLKNVVWIDFIKIDTEGYEQEVISGSKELIFNFKPVILMEMNHWCLSAFRRRTVPDFMDFVCSSFPIVHAIHDDGYRSLAG